MQLHYTRINRIRLIYFFFIKMYLSTLIVPLSFALAALADAVADPQPLPIGMKQAIQYKRDASDLVLRDSSDAAYYCGSDFQDCGDGWCCMSGEKCAGKLYDIPVCTDPTNTYTGLLGNTMPAIPYKDPAAAQSSVNSVLAEITAGHTPTQFHSATSTGAAAHAQSTGASTGGAAGGPSNFGKTAGLVGAIWGVAALGGAGLFFL